MYPGARLCSSVEDLPPETTAAIVAVPNALHAPITVNLLLRGIHVLCEKPMATTVESCREMIIAAQETDAVLMIGHHKRFVPCVSKAKQLIGEGRLGAIRSVAASMGLVRTWRSRTNFHRDRSLAGGGVLMDFGVHLIDLILWLIGDVQVVGSHRLPHGTALEEEAKIEFRSGLDVCGVLRVSDCRVLPNVFRVEGVDGFLEFDTYDYPSLKVNTKRSLLCRNLACIAFQWRPESPYRSQLEYFTNALKAPQSLALNTGHDGMQAVSVVSSAYEAADRCGA
jgi:predicted dehydrogenase